MHAVFVACLFGGFVATVLFAALGALGGAGHAAGHLHAASGHAGPLSTAGTPHGHLIEAHAPQAHAQVHAQGPHTGAQSTHVGAQSAHAGAHALPMAARFAASVGWTLSWLSPLTLAAAALWFGGIGLLTEGLLPHSFQGLALLPALIAALLGAAFVRGLMAALVRAGTPPLQADAEGALGTINAPIRADGPGEVIYTLDGLRSSAPARSVDGTPLPRGTSVVIVRRERGMAWVQPLDPLAALGRGEPIAAEPGSGASDGRQITAGEMGGQITGGEPDGRISGRDADRTPLADKQEEKEAPKW